MERLQKVLAQAGIASRRAAEQIILAGRVRVDGKIVRELGTQVDPRLSRIEVDGTKIVAEKLVYIVLHKPRGVVCTLSDPEGRPTIKELLKDAGARVIPVGRLDFHTSGALLCTNDGEFAQALAHPTKSVPKVYVAKVKGAVDDEALERFGERIVIDGRPTQPAKVERLRFEGDKTWLEITLREGRNRQVRRLGEATGFPVMRLARISHAGVTSEDLRPGQWRPLTVDELVELKRDYGVPKKVRAPIYDPAAGRDATGRGTVGRPTRGDERGAKRSKAPKDRRETLERELNDPFSRAARSVPKRAEGGRPEKPRFDAKTEGVERGESTRSEPRDFRARSSSPRSQGSEPRDFNARASSSRSHGSEPRSFGGRAGASRSQGVEPRDSRARASSSRSQGSEPRSFGGRAGTSRSQGVEPRDSRARVSTSRSQGSEPRSFGGRAGTSRSQGSEPRDSRARASSSRSQGSEPRSFGGRAGTSRSQGSEPRDFRARPGSPRPQDGESRGGGAGSPRSKGGERSAPKRFEGKAVEARRAESRRADEKRSSARFDDQRGAKKATKGPSRPARSRSMRESAGAAEPIRAKRDGRASAPRRGTSR